MAFECIVGIQEFLAARQEQVLKVSNLGDQSLLLELVKMDGSEAGLLVERTESLVQSLRAPTSRKVSADLKVSSDLYNRIVSCQVADYFQSSHMVDAAIDRLEAAHEPWRHLHVCLLQS